MRLIHLACAWLASLALIIAGDVRFDQQTVANAQRVQGVSVGMSGVVVAAGGQLEVYYNVDGSTAPSTGSVTLEQNISILPGAEVVILSGVPSGKSRTRRYTYDRVGNRLTTTVGNRVMTATYDSLNRLMTSQWSDESQPTLHHYDLNGNTVSRTRQGTTLASLSWDIANRLVGVVAEGVSTSYAYDYRTRRVIVAKQGQTTRFRYDQGECYAEHHADPTRNTTLIRAGGLGGGIGSVVHRMEGATTRAEVFHYNPAVGHVLLTTGNEQARVQATMGLANGMPGYDGDADLDGNGAISGADLTMAQAQRIKSANQYDGWGVQLSRWGLSSNARLANTKERDEIGGLLIDNHGYRYYDPLLGRYISRDPMGYVDGANVYAYVGGNPINRVDPEGQFWSILVTAVVAAVDTYQYATGKISGKEYAGRMALNGAALVADVATGGMGGGLAVRGAAMAARSVKEVAKQVVKEARNEVIDAVKQEIKGQVADAVGEATGLDVRGAMEAVDGVNGIRRKVRENRQHASGGVDTAAGAVDGKSGITAGGNSSGGSSGAGAPPGAAAPGGGSSKPPGGGKPVEGNAGDGDATKRGAGAADDVASKIANGHAFDKHKLNRGEFPEIRTRQQFQDHARSVMDNPTAARDLSGGRKAYWHQESGTVVITNPKAADGGTMFQPTQGIEYFNGLK